MELSIIILLLFCCQLCSSANIPLGSTLTPSSTTPWTSPSQTFSLSFVPAPQSPSSYLAAITASSVPIWAAAAGAPVPASSSLSLSSSGNLILASGSGGSGVLWQSSTSNMGVTSASLDDSGSLRLLSANSIVWQSFDHPTDTLVQTQNLTSVMASDPFAS